MINTNIIDSYEISIFPTYVNQFFLEKTPLFEQMTDRFIEIKHKKIHYGSHDNDIDTYCTKDNLHEIEEFTELTKIIKTCFDISLDRLDIKHQGANITAMWTNIHSNKNGGFHDLHLHANSYLSCVLYVNVPEGAGNILFEDPRERRNMVVWDSKNSNNNYEKYRSWEFSPKTAMLIVFPSYLRHKVRRGKYNDDEHRIVISANCIPNAECSETTLRYKYSNGIAV